MSNVTYEQIQPLLTKEELQGSTMSCAFKCPVSDQVVEANGTVRVQRQDGLAAKAKTSFKRNLLSSVRRSVMGAVSGALGHGIFGRTGREVAGGAMSGVQKNANQPKMTDVDKQAAVVDAFKSVLSKFAWDAENNRWISAQAAGESLTDFAGQLQDAPVQQKYDVGVLARMLTEIAAADGDIAEEEKAMLYSFLPADMGTVSDLINRPPLSKMELEEVAEGGVRDTMLMLAWAIALTDEQLDDAEQQKLTAFADGLGIDEERRAVLKSYAQKHIVTGAIQQAYADGALQADEKEDLLNLAQGIGLSEEDTERLEIKYRKRMGIV